MQKKYFVLSLCYFISLNDINYSMQSISKKSTHINHPNIDGFTYNFGYETKQLVASNSYGYIYYDMDLYYTPFTQTSRLYLMHLKGEYTSGYVATLSGQSGFNDKYDNDAGLLSINIRRVIDNYHVSSNLTPVASWPQSSSQTATVTSSFGASLTLGSEFERGVSIDDATITKTNSTSIQFSYNNSVSVTGEDPQISCQTDASNVNKTIWTYKYASYGRTTYVLDTYYLFEVKNNGVNFQEYSFAFDVELKLDAVSYHGWLWENHQYVTAEFPTGYGLYVD